IGTVHRACPRNPQPASSALAASIPLVAARSISATGRSTRVRAPASTTAGSGVGTAGRLPKGAGGKKGRASREAWGPATHRGGGVSARLVALVDDRGGGGSRVAPSQFLDQRSLALLRADAQGVGVQSPHRTAGTPRPAGRLALEAFQHAHIVQRPESAGAEEP